MIPPGTSVAVGTTWAGIVAVGVIEDDAGEFDGESGVAVATDVAEGAGVLVAGTAVWVGEIGVAVSGTRVWVGGIGVAVYGARVWVGGIGVAVDGARVWVGGTGVAVGGTGLWVEVRVGVGVAVARFAIAVPG